MKQVVVPVVLVQRARGDALFGQKMFQKIFAGLLLFLFACSGQDLTSPQADTAEYFKQFQNTSLKVDYHSPQGEVGPDLDRIVLHFTQPMVGLEQIGQSPREDLVSISPSLKGQFYWANTRTWVFEPSQAVDAKQTYRVKVGVGQESLLGRALLRDHEFEFRVNPALKSPVMTHELPWRESFSENTVDAKSPEIPAPQIESRHLLNVTLAAEKNIFSPDEEFTVQGQVQGDPGRHRVWLRVFSDPDEMRLWLKDMVKNQAKSPEGIANTTTRDQFHFSQRAPQDVGRHGLAVVARSAKGAFGVASFYFQVEFPVTLDFSLPEWMNLGDSISIPLKLSNHRPEIQSCEIQHQGADFLLTSQGSRKVSLEPLAQASVPLSLFVRGNPSAQPAPDGHEAEFELRCVAKKFTAFKRQPLKIFYPFEPRHEKFFGVLKKSRTISLKKLPDWHGDFGGIYLYFGADPQLVASRWGKGFLSEQPILLQDRSPALAVKLNQEEILPVSLSAFQDHDEIFLPMDKLPASMDLRLDQTSPGWLFYLVDLVYAEKTRFGGTENGATLTMKERENGRHFDVSLFLEKSAEDLLLKIPLPSGSSLLRISSHWPLTRRGGQALSTAVNPSEELFEVVQESGELLFSLPRVDAGYHKMRLDLDPRFAGRFELKPAILMQKQGSGVLAQMTPPAIIIP